MFLGEIFNNFSFWRWFFDGCWQAVILAWFSLSSVDNNFSNGSSGRMCGFWDIGMMILTASMIIVNVKVLLFTNTYNFLIIFFVSGGILVYIIGIVIDSSIISGSLYGTIGRYKI